MFKIFFYINELNDIQKENLNQLRNVNIIYRNYEDSNYYKNAIKINKYCKKRNFKLFVSNDKQLAIKLGSYGLYLPSFNNRDYFAQSNIKVIGSNKAIDDTAGPGHKPTNPQPAPKRKAPIKSFLSKSFF